MGQTTTSARKDSEDVDRMSNNDITVTFDHNNGQEVMMCRRRSLPTNHNHALNLPHKSESLLTVDADLNENLNVIKYVMNDDKNIIIVMMLLYW